MVKITVYFFLLFGLVLLWGCGEENQPPARPELLYPSPGNVVETDLTVMWDCDDPDGDILTYTVWVGDSILADDHVSKSYSVTGLIPGEQYTWHVEANDGQGGVTPSLPASFTVRELPPERSLAEEIVGSWRDAEASNMTYVMDGMSAEGAMEMTFYHGTRFDLITTMVYTLTDGTNLATVTMITSGDYQAFEASVALRPSDTKVMTDPPELHDLMGETMAPIKQTLENSVLGTSQARVQGIFLWLDEDKWERI